MTDDKSGLLHLVMGLASAGSIGHFDVWSDKINHLSLSYGDGRIFAPVLRAVARWRKASLCIGQSHKPNSHLIFELKHTEWVQTLISVVSLIFEKVPQIIAYVPFHVI